MRQGEKVVRPELQAIESRKLQVEKLLKVFVNAGNYEIGKPTPAIADREWVKYVLVDGLVKGLKCLYGIDCIFTKTSLTLNEMYQEVTNLVMESSGYPRIASVKISIDGSEFKSGNYGTTEWKLCKPIWVEGTKSGLIEMYYLDSDILKPPFLREEMLYLKAISRRLSEITEQRRLRDSMLFYIADITRAQEKERKRIAHELHDEIAQSLADLCRNIGNTMELITNKDESSERIKNCLKQLADDAVAITDAVRSCSHRLRPQVLDQLGLIPALRLLVGELRKESHFKIHLNIVGSDERLAVEKEVILYRITYEALYNVRKHSNATDVLVALEFTDREIRLCISDNGRGFVLPRILDYYASRGKLGLIGMRERVRLVNGEFCVSSNPGRGTSIMVKILK